jgi:hypothetical protein
MFLFRLLACCTFFCALCCARLQAQENIFVNDQEALFVEGALEGGIKKVAYAQSRSAKKINFVVEKYVEELKMYMLRIPSVKDRFYYITVLPDGNLSFKQYAGVKRTFIKKTDPARKFVCKQLDGAQESIFLMASGGKVHQIFYSSTTLKARTELEVVSRNDEEFTYVVRLPQGKESFTLHWQYCPSVSVNQVVVYRPDDIAQLFVYQAY